MADLGHGPLSRLAAGADPLLLLLLLWPEVGVLQQLLHGGPPGGVLLQAPPEGVHQLGVELLLLLPEGVHQLGVEAGLVLALHRLPARQGQLLSLLASWW